MFYRYGWCLDVCNEFYIDKNKFEKRFHIVCLNY